MRPFFYTLILTGILVASLITLRSMQTHPKPTSDRGNTRSPMAVRSQPAVEATIDSTKLDRTNQAALYDTGMELLDLWHLPEAVGVFEALVEQDPRNYDAYLELVECYSHPMIAQEKKARLCWETARDIAVETGRDTTWVSAVKDLFIDVAPSSAVQKLKRCLKDPKRNYPAELYIATAYVMWGKTDTAEGYLKDLLDGDQSLGRARELLIQCKVAQGELTEAESLAKDLAALYPEEPYPYVMLARVLLIEGRLQSAVEFANNALLLDNRYIPAIVARANLYVAEGDCEAARVSFEKLQLFDIPMLSSIGAEGIAYVDFFSGHFDEASEGMDDAIRLAMTEGSTRRGLLYSFQLIDCLCELGRVDAAKGVMDRWVSRQGPVPTHLAQLRINISRGDLKDARGMLDLVQDNDTWRGWMRTLGIDYDDIRALTLIQDKNFTGALKLLGSGEVQSLDARTAYLKGFALFQNGQAEQAVAYFDAAKSRLNELQFPYHSDPILHVQSIFFLAEAAIARGDGTQAKRFYEDFLALWGDAKWDVQAVERARQKLETLSSGSQG